MLKNIKYHILFIMLFFIGIIVSGCTEDTLEKNIPNQQSHPLLLNNTPTLGRYIEKTLDTTPHDQVSYCISPNNTFEVFETTLQTDDEGNLIPRLTYKTMQTNKLFMKKDLPWDNEKYLVSQVLDSDYNSDGKQFILYKTQTTNDIELNNENPYHLAWINTEEKSLVPIDVEWMVSDLSGKNASPLSAINHVASVDVALSTASNSDDGVSFSYDVLATSIPLLLHMEIADNGDIFISDSFGALMQYSQDGDFQAMYITSNSTFAIVENTLLIANENNNQLLLYDIAKGAINPNTAPDIGSSLIGMLLASNQDSFFITTKDGIYRLPINGTLWEKIVDGNTTSLSMPSLVFSNFLTSNNDQFYLQGINNENRQAQFYAEKPAEFLYQYSYDENIPTRLSKQITILVENETSAINQAAALFRQNYPDTYVIIEVYDDSIPFNEYVEDQLQTNNPPDIILFDTAPQKTPNNQLFYDLSNFVAPYIESEQWPSYITNAYRHNDGTLPLVASRFEFQLVAANPIITNINEFVLYAKSHPTEPILYDKNPATLVRQFFPAVSHTIVDAKTNTINTAELSVFLQQIKTLVKNIPDNELALYEQEQLLQNAIAYGINENDLSTDDMLPYIFGDVTSSIQTIIQPSMYPLFQNIENRIVYPYKPFPIGDVYPFSPHYLIGIAKKSQNVDMSILFLETFFSRKIQSEYMNEFMPLNINYIVIRPTLANNDTYSSQVFYDFTGRSFTVDNATSLGEANFVSLKNLYQKFGYVAYNNTAFITQLSSTATQYTENKIILQDAINQITSFMES